MRRGLVAITLLSCLQVGVAAGQSWTISGYVEDASSGERLQRVAIGVPALAVGTVSNAYGFYSLTVQADSVTLLVSHIGYEAASHALVLSADRTLDVALAPRTIELD